MGNPAGSRPLSKYQYIHELEKEVVRLQTKLEMYEKLFFNDERCICKCMQRAEVSDWTCPLHGFQVGNYPWLFAPCTNEEDKDGNAEG